MIDYDKVVEHIQKERLKEARVTFLLRQSKPSFRETLVSLLYRWSKRIELAKRITIEKRLNS